MQRIAAGQNYFGSETVDPTEPLPPHLIFSLPLKERVEQFVQKVKEQLVEPLSDEFLGWEQYILPINLLPGLKTGGGKEVAGCLADLWIFILPKTVTKKEECKTLFFSLLREILAPSDSPSDYLEEYEKDLAEDFADYNQAVKKQRENEWQEIQPVVLPLLEDLEREKSDYREELQKRGHEIKPMLEREERIDQEMQKTFETTIANLVALTTVADKAVAGEIDHQKALEEIEEALVKITHYKGVAP